MYRVLDMFRVWGSHVNVIGSEMAKAWNGSTNTPLHILNLT